MSATVPTTGNRARFLAVRHDLARLPQPFTRNEQPGKPRADFFSGFNPFASGFKCWYSAKVLLLEYHGKHGTKFWFLFHFQKPKNDFLLDFHNSE